MVYSISSVAFQGSPYTVTEKLKNKKLNRTLANSKATELLAKNETVEKSIPKKKKPVTGLPGAYTAYCILRHRKRRFP